MVLILVLSVYRPIRPKSLNRMEHNCKSLTGKYTNGCNVISWYYGTSVAKGWAMKSRMFKGNHLWNKSNRPLSLSDHLSICPSISLKKCWKCDIEPDLIIEYKTLSVYAREIISKCPIVNWMISWFISCW